MSWDNYYLFVEMLIIAVGLYWLFLYLAGAMALIALIQNVTVIFFGEFLGRLITLD